MPLRWAQDHFFPGPERIGLHAAQVSRVSRLWPAAAGCSGKGSRVLMPHLHGPCFGELQMSAEKLFFPLPFQFLMLPFKST